MTKKIALDVDGTIASMIEVVYKYLGEEETTNDDLEYYYQPSTELGEDRFLSGVREVWAYWNNDVPLIDERIPRVVKSLQDRFIVDIVTAHTDNDIITRGKKKWLADNNIPYDEFVRVPLGVSKAELEYDVYVDDKSSLPQEVNDHSPDSRVFIIDYPYNRDISGDYTRIDGVYELQRYYPSMGINHPTYNVGTQ